MKLSDLETPTGQTFRAEYKGKTAAQIVQSSDLPPHGLFSRPYCYKKVWTAHHLINGGRGGSYPMVITRRLAHQLREYYK